MKKIFIICALAFLYVPAAAGVDIEGFELVFDGADITASWDDVTETAVIEYYVYRSTWPGITSSSYGEKVTVSPGTSYTDTGADTFTAYYYTVQARDAEGGGPLAEELCVSPRPPVNIWEAEAFNSRVFLSWEKAGSEEVTAYNIYRATSPELFKNTRTARAWRDEYIDEEVINGFEYYYRISSYSESGSKGAYSPVTYAGIPFAPPFTPRALTITAGASDVSLAWSASSEGTSIFGTHGISGFSLYRDTSQDFSSAEERVFVPYSSTVNAYSASDSGLGTGTVYYYKFMTVDSAENTSVPEYFSFFSEGDDVPSAPQGVSAVCENLVSAVVLWEGNPYEESVASYTVERATEPSFDAGLSGYVSYSAQDTEYTDSQAEPGANYYYRVYANNANGPGPASSYDYVTIEAAAVTGAAVSFGNNEGELIVSWAPAAEEENITLYNVYRAQSVAGLSSATPVPGAEGATLYSYTDTGLTPSVFYYYQAAAVTTTAGGPPLNYVTGRRSVTTGAYAIGQPLSATITSATGYDGYVSVYWDPAPESGATAYNVYRSTYPTGGYSSVSGEISNTNNTYYFDNTVTNGIGYYYMVTTGNKFGGSAADPETSAYVDVTPASAAAPPAPESAAFTSCGDGSISLSWESAAPVSYYNIYRSTYTPPDAYYTQAISSPFSEQAMILTDTASVTTPAWYYYRITSVDGSYNEGPYSGIVSGTAYVAPNPVNGLEAEDLYDSIFLAWEEPSMPYTYGLSGYNIYRSTSSGDFSAPFVEKHTKDYYRDFTVSRGAEVYYYMVEPVDIQGNTGGADDVSLTIEEPESPPKYLASRAGDGRVTLIWTIGDPEYYNIYRSTVPDIYGAPIASNIAFDRKEYIDEDPALTNGTVYYYTVTGVNSAGEGEKSLSTAAMPYKAVELPENRDVEYEIRNKKNVYLSWEAASGGSGGGEPALSGYNVYRSDSGGGLYEKANSVTITATDYLDDTTEWDNVYYYMVKTVDEYGNEDGIYNLAVVELPLPENKIRVFSNLVDLSKGEELKLKYFIVSAGKIKLSVHTLSGEFVKTLFEGEKTGEISEEAPYESPAIYWDGTNAFGEKVSAGVYYLIMEAGGERIIEKAAVVR